MNKYQYSDQVGKLATMQQAQDRYKLCRHSIMRYGKQWGAILKIGSSVRVDIEKFDAGLSKLKY